MQVSYKFKLQPNPKQASTLEDWQHKVCSIQNRAIGDRIDTYAKTFVMGDYCDLFTFREISQHILYCNIETKALISPLYCSVNKSASLGNPWKEDVPSRRRGKDKEKPFNPRRSAYEMHSSWVTEFKKKNPTYQLVNADVFQQSLRQVDLAFSKFFSGKAKYPNFRQHKDVGIKFKPGTVRIINSRIIFPLLGGMRCFKSREIPETWEIRTSHIVRDIDGWYVVVLLRDETVPAVSLKAIVECETIQGADVGIKKLVALSDGTMIENPEFSKKSKRRLEIRQRRVSRKQKGSNNRQKTVKRLARTHQKIRRQREDYQWKSAKKIAKNADITTFENLNIKGMMSRCQPKIDAETGKYVSNGQAAKAGLNKVIQDASWYSLRQKTKHQASKIGNLVIEVDPKYTSQECPNCHHISKGNRDKEKFVCEECSYSADADTTGAVNQAHRGKKKLGIETLRVVSPEVTPTETDEKPQSSDVSRSEPGNPAKSNITVKKRQLRLLTVKSVPVEPKPRAKRNRKNQTPQHTQRQFV